MDNMGRASIFNISVLRMLESESREVAAGIEELTHLPMLPQVIALCDARLNVGAKESGSVGAVVGIDGTKITICSSGGIIHASEGSPQWAWRPYIDLSLFRGFLEETGLIEAGSSGGRLLFNPFPYETFFIVNRQVIGFKPFSARLLDERFEGGRCLGDSIGLSSEWHVDWCHDAVRIKSAAGIEVSIGSSGWRCNGLYTASGSMVLSSSAADVAINVVHGLIYIKAYTDLSIGTNLISYPIRVLNPFFISRCFVGVNDKVETRAGWVHIGGLSSFSIVNPLFNRIVVGRDIMLPRGGYMLVMGDRSACRTHAILLGLLACSEWGDKVFMDDASAIVVNEFLARAYPSRVLLGEISYTTRGVKMVLFNPDPEPHVIEYYTVLPISRAVAYTPRVPRGFNPILIKPNMLRVGVRPYDIVVLVLEFKEISKRAIKYMVYARRLASR